MQTAKALQAGLYPKPTLNYVGEQNMSDEFMNAIWSRKETPGMRATDPMSVKGLMTVMRVLPDDLYDLLMNSNQPVEKEAVFAEVVRRFGSPDQYQSAPGTMAGMNM